MLYTTFPVNLPVLLGTKRVVGRQAGGYRQLCDLARNVTARWPVQKKAILGLKLIHAFVPPSENTSWVGEWKSQSKSWERKGVQLHSRQEGQLKVLCPHLSHSLMAMVVPQAGASHPLQFSAVKVNKFSFWFIFMHRTGSFISPRADSRSRLHLCALRTAKTSAAQI